VTLNSEEIKPLTIAIIELHLSEGISKGVSQSVSRSIGRSVIRKCVAFFESCGHLVCNLSSCRWASHSRFHNLGCRYLGVRCGALLVSASEVMEIPHVGSGSVLSELLLLLVMIHTLLLILWTLGCYLSLLAVFRVLLLWNLMCLMCCLIMCDGLSCLHCMLYSS